MALTHEHNTSDLDRMAEVVKKEREAMEQNPTFMEAPRPESEPEVTGMIMGVIDTPTKTKDGEVEEVEEPTEETATEAVTTTIEDVDETEEAEEDEESDVDTSVVAAAQTNAQEARTNPLKIAERKTPKRGHKKAWAILGAGAALLTLAGGALGISAMGSSKPKEAAVATVPEDPKPESPVSTEGGSTPETQTPAGEGRNLEADPTAGNIQTAQFMEGEPIVEASRNGTELIQVPRLRDLDQGAEAVTSSFMSLFACAATTGEQACYDAISMDPAVQEQVRNTVDDVKQRMSQEFGSDVPSSYQVSVFDLPDDKATPRLTMNGESGATITNAGGTIYMSPYYSPVKSETVWQGPETHRSDYSFTYSLDSMNLTFGKDAKGNTTTTNVDWKWSF